MKTSPERERAGCPIHVEPFRSGLVMSFNPEPTRGTRPASTLYHLPMVRLTKIYTRTGDDGTTGLGDASRVPKTDIRVAAYGTVDEANAAIGVCIAHLRTAPGAGGGGGPHAGALVELLSSIQNDLFDVGADLCCVIKPGEKPGASLRVTPGQTERLEHAIDEHNERLSTLNSFILPGGSMTAAAMHMARTISRRAERDVVALLAAQPAKTNPETVRYLNRLSDLLFVLARVANDDGKGDVLWKPGATRG